MSLRDCESEGVELKDRTKHIWLGVVALFVLMVGAVFVLSNTGAPDVSRARVRHILITYKADDPADRGRAMEQAKDILQRIRNGENFGKLAKQFSNDPGSAAQGGDLGWMKKGSLDKAIENYVWSAPLNQLSDVIRSDYGYHVVEVLQRKYSTFDEGQQKTSSQKNAPAPTGS